MVFERRSQITDASSSGWADGVNEVVVAFIEICEVEIEHQKSSMKQNWRRFPNHQMGRRQYLNSLRAAARHRPGSLLRSRNEAK